MTKRKFESILCKTKTEMILSSCTHFDEVMILRFVVISQISSAFSLLSVSASWNCHLVETIYIYILVETIYIYIGRNYIYIYIYIIVYLCH